MRRLFLTVLAVLALAACGSEETSTPEATTPQGNASPVAGNGLEGEPVSLADFRGKPVFVNVWSSW